MTNDAIRLNAGDVKKVDALRKHYHDAIGEVLLRMLGTKPETHDSLAWMDALATHLATSMRLALKHRHITRGTVDLSLATIRKHALTTEGEAGS